jgi:endonuclease/exonuclease/phosphatase family metal-dependent hydrolase
LELAEMTAAPQIRVVTYNIHKCRGLDRRISPSRIAEVLRKLNADCIALQEVVRTGGSDEGDQAQFIAESLKEYDVVFGPNRPLGKGDYGNATLSRLPVQYSENYNLTCAKLEPRGCLRTDLLLPNGGLLHFFNVHLGTGFTERRLQGAKLLSESLLRNAAHTGPRLIVGDFNEWSRGLTSKSMAQEFRSVDPREHQRRAKTYPGVLPMLHLDHIYYDHALELKKFRVVKTARALLASDHLPLVADFAVDDQDLSTANRPAP